MNPLIALLAPIALLVPVPVREAAPPDAGAELAPGAAPVAAAANHADRLDPLVTPVAEQVRIEQRVIVRIAPPGPALRPSALAEGALPMATPRRLNERKIGKCLPVNGIAAVQPEGASRLLLLMRDRRLISANLEKACRARDFYSGFYIERSGDGMLCVDRDKLHSRTGANCEISRMRQLVADED